MFETPNIPLFPSVFVPVFASPCVGGYHARTDCAGKQSQESGEGAGGVCVRKPAVWDAHMRGLQ